MNNKGKKTTIVAIIGIILVLGIFVAWFMKRIETSELSMALTAVSSALVIVIGLFAKDADQSHTKDTGGELPDDDDEDDK